MSLVDQKVFVVSNIRVSVRQTQKGYGPTAVQTELQRVPRVHLTKPIIALFVVMKAQFSEVYYNKSHSENSGNGSTGRRGCDGSAVA